MKVIPLTQIPNQALSFNAGAHFWKLRIFQDRSFVMADISCDGVVILNGVRCFGGIPLIPYRFLYAPDSGNFVFDTDADWTKFGADCNLYYLDPTEFVEYNALLRREA